MDHAWGDPLLAPSESGTVSILSIYRTVKILLPIRCAATRNDQRNPVFQGFRGLSLKFSDPCPEL